MYFYKTLLILALLTIPAFSLTDDHITCKHDHIEQKPETFDLDEQPPTDEGRLLATYPALRIYPHYDLLKSAPSAYKSYIEKELTPPVIDLFEAAVQVKYPVSGKLVLAKKVTKICDDTTPSVLFTGVNADIFFMLDSKLDTDSSWVASSYFCYVASGSKRPFIVKTTFNRDLLKDANGDAVVHEKNTYLLIHEFIHNLGFSKSMYPTFLNDKGKTLTGHVKTVKTAGESRTVLNVPSLTTRLRNFFGCSKIEGAYMENDGGDGTAGSHFERRHFVYDTMTSGVIHGRRLSEFSLAMIEATGWYTVDYTFAEPYFFGQGQGCDFLNKTCSSSTFSFDEFCKGSDRGCAPHGRGGGYCSTDSKSDGCRYYAPDLDYDCENENAKDNSRLPTLQTYGRGLGSRCFSGDLTNTKSSTSQTSFCFKYTCQGTGASTSVVVQVGTTKVTCKKEGKLAVTGYTGGINCPDPLAFCNTVGKEYCPRNCMGRGKCVSNKCVCNKGFSGIDCGLSA